MGLLTHHACADCLYLGEDSPARARPVQRCDDGYDRCATHRTTPGYAATYHAFVYSLLACRKLALSRSEASHLAFHAIDALLRDRWEPA